MKPRIAGILAAIAAWSAGVGCGAANGKETAPASRPPCSALPLDEQPAVIETSSLAREPPRRMFRRSSSRYRCCYHRLLAREPSAAPTVIVEVDISSGRVVQAGVEADEGDAAFSECVTDVARQMVIPEWSDTPPELITIRYPLRFVRPTAHLDLTGGPVACAIR